MAKWDILSAIWWGILLATTIHIAVSKAQESTVSKIALAVSPENTLESSIKKILSEIDDDWQYWIGVEKIIRSKIPWNASRVEAQKLWEGKILISYELFTNKKDSQPQTGYFTIKAKE